MRAIDHINIDVNDLEPCLAFYRDDLGLELVREPMDFAGDHAMFRVGDTSVTLMETGRANDWDMIELDHPLDKAHLAFEADSEQYVALVERLDGQFPKQGPYNWEEFEGFYFLDPSGNLLEVVTHELPRHNRELLTHDDVE